MPSIQEYMMPVVNQRANEECFPWFVLIYVKASLMVAIVTEFVARNDILLAVFTQCPIGVRAQSQHCVKPL